MSMPDAGGANDAGGENDVTARESAEERTLAEQPADPDQSERSATLEQAEEPAPTEALEEREPIVTSVEREVTVERSVRYGRILIAGAVLGALIAIIASLLRPVGEGAEYTLSEVAGFMALIGAAIGLGVGGLFALILTLVARKRRGSAVAVQSDVQ